MIGSNDAINLCVKIRVRKSRYYGDKQCKQTEIFSVIKFGNNGRFGNCKKNIRSNLVKWKSGRLASGAREKILAGGLENFSMKKSTWFS